ncbi:MAG: peptidylprolyl isomerase [Planctomycetota bacterium]
MPRSLVVTLLGLFLAGCFTGPPPENATPEKKGAPNAPAPPLEVSRPSLAPGPDSRVVPRDGAGDVAVARVGDDEILRSEIGDFMIRFFRDQANQALNHLIDERILEEEVRLHGLSLPAGALERAVAAELRKRETEVKVQFGADTTLAGYLEDRYGTTLDEHEKNLERLYRVRLLRDRLIRFHQLREDRIEVRDAVFATEGEAAKAARSARDGADLATLAREHGLRPDVALPPVPRDALRPPELEAAVFALEEGEVSDPIAVLEGERKVYHVFKVIRRTAAREVTWGRAREEVEEGLAKAPLEQHEHHQWARQMREKYKVDILR